MKIPRPLITKIAMCCLVVSNVAGSVQMITRVSWTGVFTYVLGIPTLLTLWLLIILIIRGQNWARWLLLGYTGFGLVLFLFDHPGVKGLNADGLFHLILDMIVVLLLFTPSSNDWFHHNKKLV
jgi:hypothetical protein